MPKRLRRYYGAGHLHFITTSCFQRRALLGTPRRRDLLVKILEEVRQRYHFVVVGYVVMPEHVHFLLGEPERGNPSVVTQVLKQRYARALLRKTKQPHSPLQGSLWEMSLEPEHVWQTEILRLCGVESGQDRGENPLHARQPGEARPGTDSRTMALEQCAGVHFGRSRASAAQ
jgi:REP element-mobilizing transposase RayT